MSNLQLIERLCGLLDLAQGIIREQAALILQPGIETDDGELERRRTALLTDVENSI